MTFRARLAVAAALAALGCAGCATAAPDYQSVWSTPSATTTAPAATTDADRVPIAAFLEKAGVIGEPVVFDKLTDLTVSMPTPPGWTPYQGTNLAPGARMIVKGDTYPTAMLMVFELDGDFDAREAVTHGNVDAEMSENFTELNSSATDFGGFPSSMIEGSYDLNGSRMHTYNRIVIATGAPQKPGAGGQRYLIQFTVTGYADKAAEESTDMETIISGFTVEVPK
ncbi:LpqN/LpqT family lipoprotein [Mycolicibacterium pyrenivorans]|uniref:LpqN/LpqT family lipoprotein n=1 Tax=Mycolicibacterium pyrenivorans TaxID=187102 RepID=UPI0021F26E9B|nr:LpqN/LpqT family lipoprotein [Mycolicibacterium pyrenivorans]MCV7150035.1 LpqN/LpqT family lipoprotein [Mycolicibacterium pyrenivorans]